ncbi:MAG: non-ribosomal peptide synthetase, partial [Bryobacteraceae bacterium]
MSPSLNFNETLRTSLPVQTNGLLTMALSFAEEEVEEEVKGPDCDLALCFTETGADLRCRWTYDRNRFAENAIARMNGHFHTLLHSLAAKPDSAISEATSLTEAERAQILVDWNQTSTGYPRNATVHELFSQQAALTPDAIAVIDKDQAISYRELNRRANQLAHYLRSLGVRPGSAIGISLDRSIPMVVAMIASLKAGACYLQLDAGYPGERLRFMIEDAHPAVLITDSSHAHKLAAHGARFVALDTEQHCIDNENAENPAEAVKATDLAYIMYTSGSTGNPKGVEVVHRGIVRLVRNTTYVEFKTSDVVGQVANSSFDAITFEVWGALLNGSRLAIVPTEIVLSPERFSDTIRKQNISTMFLTASLFSVIVARKPDAFSTMRNLLVGGDAVPPEHARKVLQTAPPERLLNGYGPTECTTFALWHLIDDVPANATAIPVGRPLSNTRALILDNQLQPVPAGVPGMLYLGGDALARGYLNRPELTAERFVSDPFDRGGRLYKTGDLARYREDGVIEFLGRADHQIKFHGFRIELGEIEAALRQHPQVDDCVTVITDGAADERRLVAYVASSAEPHPSPSDLRIFLRSKLPEFMVPAIFVVLKALPLSAVGKVDRSALPAPQPAFRTAGAESPTTEMQRAIAAIWKTAAGIENPGLDDNFFDLGGNSLAIAAIEAELRSRFDADLPVTDLFRYPTIR